MDRSQEEVAKAGIEPSWDALGLVEVGLEKLGLQVCNEDEEELSEPYTDYKDYCYRGKLIAQPAMRVFKLRAYPATELLYPLDKPTYPRLMPSDAVALLKSAPDLRLIKRLIILDDLDEDEAWFKQITKFPWKPQDIAISAKASALDELTVYRAQSVAAVEHAFDREWLTIVKQNSLGAAHIFAIVQEFEELKSNHPNIGMIETAWCEFGLSILNQTIAVSLVVAEQNPIRSAIVATAIEACLKNLPQELQSPRHEQILGRCKYMSGRVSNIAATDLNNRLMNPTQDQISRISKILEFLQSTED